MQNHVNMEWYRWMLHESIKTKRNAFPYLRKHASEAFSLIFTLSNHFTHFKTILKFLTLSIFFPLLGFSLLCYSLLVTSLLCLVTPLPSNIFCWVGTPGDRAKLVLNLHSWKTIYLKIIALFLSSFWCTTFLFLSLRCNISSGGEKIIRFLLFWIRFTCVFRRGLRGKNRRNPFEEKLFLTCYSCSWDVLQIPVNKLTFYKRLM